MSSLPCPALPTSRGLTRRVEPQDVACPWTLVTAPPLKEAQMAPLRLGRVLGKGMGLEKGHGAEH